MQMFSMPEPANRSMPWTALRQGIWRSMAPQADAAPTTPRGEEMSPRAEPQQAEDWAGDCLFDCYND